MGKQKPELPQGTLDMLVLKALSLGAMHGYGVGQRIGQLAGEMQQRGWIKSEWGVSENKRRARFYKLTRTGRKQLEVEEAKWSYLSLAIGKVLRTA
jgi:PadR family transcriptional regulator PadR